MAFSPSLTKYQFLAALFLLLPVGACDPFTASVGAGALVTAAAAEDKGISGVYSDSKIRTKINMCWLNKEPVLMDRLFLSVQQGHVLLTGVVESEELKEKAAHLTQSIPGVVKLINDIQVGKPQGLGDYSQDAWITTKLKARLLFTKGVALRNYSIRTVGQKVYLMGLAKDRAEIERVIACASSLSGVRDIINYTVLKRASLDRKAPRKNSYLPDDGDDVIKEEKL